MYLLKYLPLDFPWWVCERAGLKNRYGRIRMLRTPTERMKRTEAGALELTVWAWYQDVTIQKDSD